MKHIYNSTSSPLYLNDIKRCSGCYIYDQSNKKYLDFESGVWALPLGHNHPNIEKAVIDQLPLAQHVGYKYNHCIVDLTAKKLIELTKIQKGKCVFLSSGSEAVDYAIRIAKKIMTKKNV